MAENVLMGSLDDASTASGSGSMTTTPPPATDPTAGWVASTPLSMTATFTPAPVLPSHAHARVIAAGSDRGTRASVAGANCHDQAGFTGDAGGRRRGNRWRSGPW